MRSEETIILTRREAERMSLEKQIKEVEDEIIELGQVISIKQKDNEFMHGIVEERKLLIAKMWMLTREYLHGNNGFA